jgi:hypothetical protein
MLCFEVADGFDELVQVHVGSAKVSIGRGLEADLRGLGDDLYN